MNQFNKMTVGRIVNDGDRRLLFESRDNPGDKNEYRVIASLTCPARVGDVIEYEPFGRNFGWFYVVATVAEE
jgi:hypothetical protein